MDIPTVDCDHFVRSQGCAHPQLKGQPWEAEDCYGCKLREFHPPFRPRDDLQVAVVIISHNYGEFLSEAIVSVREQTAQPSEVLVVDDSSTDHTRDVAEKLGVRYLRIGAGNVTAARKVGSEATRSPILCFLDADDRLQRQYLQCGLNEFAPQVGIVYSDVQRFGAEEAKTIYPDRSTWENIDRQNCIHSASLVRREALEATRAFERDLPREVQDDWYLWRKVLDAGWQAAKQPVPLLYRRHERNASLERPAQAYYDRAGLAYESVTLAIPLSGRTALWPQLQQWLNTQTWPHGQTALLLLDTSGDPEFQNAIRKWAWACDYPDVRLVCKSFGRPGLADAPREGAALLEVRQVTAQIYSYLARQITTRFVWIVEDDVLPPQYTAERLLRSFEHNIDSVSGLVPFRPDNGQAIAWNDNGPLLCAGKNVTPVAGNGFGCVMLRRSALQAGPLGSSSARPNYDHGFYACRIKGAALLDRVVRCEHYDNR